MSTEEPPFLSRKSHVPSKQREKAEKVLLAIRARPGTRGKWGTPPQHEFAMCTNSANRNRSDWRTARRNDPTQPTKSEVSRAMCSESVVLTRSCCRRCRPLNCVLWGYMGVDVALGRPQGPILVEIIGRVVPARCRSLLLASRPGTSVRAPEFPQAGGGW